MIRVIRQKGNFPFTLNSNTGDRSYQIYLPITESATIKLEIEILNKVSPLNFYISLFDINNEKQSIEIYSECYLKNIKYLLEKKEYRRLVIELPLGNDIIISFLVKLAN